MSELTAVIRTDGAVHNCHAILDAINPLDNFLTKMWQTPSEFLATSYSPDAPSFHKRFYRDENCVGMFAGDIINPDRFDWREIAVNLPNDAKLLEVLRVLKGAFVFVVYDRKEKVLRIATDPFGFSPLYFSVIEGGVLFSTSIGSCLSALDSRIAWSDSWVYEYLFFNYPVGEQSLVEDVQLVPAGSLGKFSAQSGRLEWIEYVGHKSSSSACLSGQPAIDKAIAMFHSVVPEWFDCDGPVTFGLSGGLDSRAVLASLSDQQLSRVSTFTYGIAGSTEVVEARNIAASLGLRHREILLDENYLTELPRLLYDTVYLSDAQQVINRSNLVYVYSALGNDKQGFSALVTGVSGDHLFRDHISAWGNVPYLISADMASLFRNGRSRIDADFYSNMFASRFADFESQIECSLDSLEQRYGDFSDAEAYFRFLMYVAGPRYFGGQAAIANSYSAFRTPYWDPDLVQLAMDIDNSTVGFSRRLSAKDEYREAILQASVVARNPAFHDIPYLNLPIKVFADANKIRFQFHRLSRKIHSLISGRNRVNEENWPLWYRTVLSDEVDKLLGPDSAIREYVSDEFIKRQIADTNIHWLGKMMTVEIALRLVGNGWKRLGV